MKKWLPVFITCLLGAIVATSPEVQHWMRGYPELAVILITVYILVAVFVTPPMKF